MKNKQHKKYDISKYAGHCWMSIPCTYESFQREHSDKYYGDIFGQLAGFDSSHWLFRRFHKSYCKAMILTHLSSYQMICDDEFKMNAQIIGIQEQNYSVELLAYHSALIALISSCEAFFKDSFRYFLQYLFHHKLNGNNIEKILRKYNFQNIESLVKAYKWLFDSFNEHDVLPTKALRDVYDKDKHVEDLFYSVEIGRAHV